MNRLKRFAMAALAMVAVFMAVPVQNASAASSASLSIVPKKNYLIEPGKSVKDTLTIRNLDSVNALQLSLRVIDFTFTNDGGTPKLFLDPNAPQTTWSLKPFMTVPQTATIPAGGSKTLDMNIAIPAGHGAGSYYSAIIYSAGNGTGPGNVGLSASGVTLAFVQIPGKVNENLQLEKFGIYNTDTSKYMYFTQAEPQNLAYTLKNNGNVTESPAGSITMTDLFGRKQIISDLNTSGSLALIGQSRTFTSCIKTKSQDVDFNGAKTEAKTCTSPGLWPGYYRLSLDVFYGQNGNQTQEVVGSAGFWYLPLWFLVACFIVLLIIAYYIWKIVRAIKRRTGRGVKFTNKPRR